MAPIDDGRTTGASALTRKTGRYQRFVPYWRSNADMPAARHMAEKLGCAAATCPDGLYGNAMQEDPLDKQSPPTSQGPLLSPDGQFYWDGSGWRPNPHISGNARQPEPDLSSSLKSRSHHGWLGLALCVGAVLLSLVLLQRPMFLIGALDVGLPLMLAMAGMVLSGKGPKPLKWISWVTGAVVVLLILLVVVALASDDGDTSGTEIGGGLSVLMAPRL